MEARKRLLDLKKSGKGRDYTLLAILSDTLSDLGIVVFMTMHILFSSRPDYSSITILKLHLYVFKQYNFRGYCYDKFSEIQILAQADCFSSLPLPQCYLSVLTELKMLRDPQVCAWPVFVSLT